MEGIKNEAVGATCFIFHPRFYSEATKSKVRAENKVTRLHPFTHSLLSKVTVISQVIKALYLN